MSPSSTAHSSTRVGSPPTRVGSPPTPFTTNTRFSSSSKRYRESTHLIPTPGVNENRPKQYDPFYLWLPVVVGTPLFMLSLGIALEIGIELSYKNGGFAVPQQNVFFVVSTQFLLSFFPTLFVIPVGYLWRVLDWALRQWQPYVTMAKGNATAEESVLLDYVRKAFFELMNFAHRHLAFLGCRPILSVFRALKYKHRVIFWSSSLAAWTYLFQPLAGSIFQLQTRGQTQSTTAQSIRSLGLAPDVSELTGFAAAAGFAQASVFNNLTDPPFVNNNWAAAQFVFPTNTGLNGTMMVNTTGIRTNSTCANPSGPPTITVVNSTSSIISATSIDGCSGNITFDPTVSTLQYGVLPVPNCGPHASLNESFWPVVFWFYQQEADNTQEVKTVFCTPTLELFYIEATADLSSGALTKVQIVNSYTKPNNLSGDPLNGVPFNAVIFPTNTTNPFINARAQGTNIGVPGAIFRAASQQFNGLQSVFDLPNGFLDLTNTIYTRHLGVTAKNVYFVAENNQLNAWETFLVPRLWIDPFPAHILAFLLFASGFVGVFLQLINRRQRRNVFLAAPPGSVAAALALTSRSGFGDLLLPCVFLTTALLRLRRNWTGCDSGSISVQARLLQTITSRWGDDSTRGPDDAMMSLLGPGYNREASHSSTQLAQEAALEHATGIPAWKMDELRTPYDP
ncbi:hypothetical protein MSAN_01165400 [Mycena sanguinolenta]|uniref:Transmembrane protein n=1 Tax=Mycena sanguinolenta TaxID=230812 RepID=A0A8H6YK32_9AGAR|nr:hypothetical protein MSAN_01165400 [Mycena sanguinolenta]